MESDIDIAIGDIVRGVANDKPEQAVAGAAFLVGRAITALTNIDVSLQRIANQMEKDFDAAVREAAKNAPPIKRDYIGKPRE